MIFGYSTNAFVKFPLSESLEKIADLGFDGVEIMGDRPHLYPPDYGAREIAELQAILRRRGLSVTNINSFTLFAVGDTYLPSWIEPEPERRQIRIRHTRDSLRMAAALGCRNISVPPGGPLGNLSRKAGLALFHAGLEQILPLAEELGVRVLVEPEPGLMLENTAEFREFIRDVRSPLVGINFDIGHFFCAGEDPRAAFEELFQWVGHMHIEDIAPDRRHQHLIAGQGTIAFRPLFEAMARLGYARDISLELYPYVDMPEQAGRESREFLLPLFRKAGLI
jgi:sugar phosphate isomerase/epimerase